MIFIYLFILLIIILIYYIHTNKIKIKFKTFLKKGFKVNNGKYGIYCYCGVQGSGKTYSCSEFVYDNKDTIQLFSNVKFNNVNYVYFNGFKEMLKLRDSIDWARYKKNNFIIFNGNKIPIEFEKQIIFIYDEIFSELQRGSRINTDILDFITQMRKRKFILLTTAQIWSDIPITWRRLTRFQIDCSLKNFFGLNLLIKVFHDAELMKWSNDEQEHLAPIISTTITHTRKCIADNYDTFQLIHNHLSSNDLSSLNSQDFEVSCEDKEDISPNVIGELKGVNVSHDSLNNDSCEILDKDFWEGDDLQSLGLR